MTSANGVIRIAGARQAGVASLLFGEGRISSLDAVETIGGEKVAYVSVAFPRTSPEGSEASEMVLPFFMSWKAFQKLLPKVD